MIHWFDALTHRNHAAAAALPRDERPVDRAACGAVVDENRQDHRARPELVSCPQCRWAWLVDQVQELLEIQRRRDAREAP